MKKLTLFTVLILLLIGVGARAQQYTNSRATTQAEYNYLVTGQFNTILPGHLLRKTNISETIEFADSRRTVTIYELYRSGSPNPCAIVLLYRKQDDGSGVNICVPDSGSDSKLWDGYSDQLNKIRDTGNALMVVAYALGKYAASH